jgi:hypothetical protein
MRSLRFLPLAVLVACSPHDSGLTTHAPTIDTLPSGTFAVTNTGPSAWADTNGWKLVLERTIAPAEGSPGEIGAPRGIVADSRGRIFLVDRQPIGIRAYAPTGEFLFAFSGEGSGPGEISGNGLLMIARDTLVFHDPSQSRTQTWTTDGEFVRGWSSICCMSMPVSADNAGRIPIPGMVYPQVEGAGMFSGAGFVRYRLDGTVIDTVRTPSLATEPKVWQFQTAGGTSANLVPLQPSDARRLSPDGRMVWGHQSAYRFAIFTPTGDTLRTFTAPAAAVPIPDSVRQRVFDEYLEGNPDELRAVAKLDDLPHTYTPWETFTFDGRGNLWVLAAGPSGGTDHFDVFDADGVLLGRVPSPLRRLYLTWWAADRVYAVVENEASGLPEIRVYRIDRGAHRSG